MNVCVVGHRGYVGQNIVKALKVLSIKNLFLIDSSTNTEEKIKFISNSNIVIHCAGIQRPLNNTIESFAPNFTISKLIVDHLPHNSNLIFISSIHYNSDTPFGYVRNMEEKYIMNNLKNFTIYHLPYTYGPYGKPNYNNVFNTFIINLLNNQEILINEFTKQYPLLLITNFAKSLIKNIHNNLGVIDKFDVSFISLPYFFSALLKVHFGEKIETDFMKDLKEVYKQYKI